MNHDGFLLEDKVIQSIPSLAKEDVLKALASSERGLSTAEAQSRLASFGANELITLKQRPLIFKFLENFYHLFAILLWVGGGMAFLADMPALGWAIFAVILINAVFSFWQEFKAEKATEALKKMMPRRARIVRNGDTIEVEASQLIPGDVLFLQEGDSISADARLFEEFDLRTNNATLTGEAEPVRKTSAAVDNPTLTRTEMPNLVFAGTSVAYGSGKAVIFATGMNTEFGKIAKMTQDVKEEESPLQKEMKNVTKVVAILAISIGLTFFFLGSFVAGLPLNMGFLFAIGIIVALMPEGLLPTVTLGLAMGVQRMAKRGAIIKKLSSVETLGSTTVICTDKTGTLTQNEMTVKELWFDGNTYEATSVGYNPEGGYTLNERELDANDLRSLEILAKIASFCNNARLLPPGDDVDKWTILGDPTEGALLTAARKAGFDYDDELSRSKRVYALPFDPCVK